ncbi:alpha/beta hydrolase [Pseudodesulfovibrio cashew]|uniref:Alpha/beta hydrolase n=1 Tax=Pseudodesulfovibrio cashew TaxID=2678688 RepID=A0A6I6JBL5_9BACT|nr:alpha/beta hydrolase [Pseudodesulfovibrio cashew]QGY40166.1 alpha/beta hydrolase [Pseudodesulfovibrio cashew]
MRAFLLTFLFTALLPLVALAGADDYRYPFGNPLQATVYGTPPDLIYDTKGEVPLKIRSIQIKGRTIPDIFSHDSEMFYSTALHDGPAPLVFVIAGTGAEHKSAKMVFLTRALYLAGFHVVALSSPTHMNFLVSVSEHGAAGYVPFDVDDLYRVMCWIKDDLAGEVEVTDYRVTGYSLGALHAAFLARKDSELGDFHFSKALLINPPVSLYHSVRRLDSWLDPETLGGKQPREEIQRIINIFSNYYKSQEITDLDDDFLYNMVTRTDLDGTDLRVLIGTDFRASSSSMIFASDVCLRAEYLVPPGAYPLKTGTPLMRFAEAAFDISFEDYMDEYLLPYVRHLEPDVDRYEFIQRCSLYAIRSYLAETDKIELLGNRDDVILNENDIRFIESVFGGRASLYPTGGHCGNMMYPHFVKRMLAMLDAPAGQEGTP